MIPELDSCCCCWSLKAGTIIIAWIHIVFGALGIIGYILLMNENSEPVFKFITKENKMMILSASILLATLFILLTVLLLFVGIHKKRLSFVLFWVHSEIVLLLMDVLGVIIISFQDAFILLYFVPLAVEVYFILVVYNYYKQEKRNLSVV